MLHNNKKHLNFSGSPKKMFDQSEILISCLNILMRAFCERMNTGTAGISSGVFMGKGRVSPLKKKVGIYMKTILKKSKNTRMSFHGFSC